MKTPITVHMIGQAHLDPIWLWNWQAGLDEALATCRAACDLLDDYPEFIFTRGEAWVYRQIEKVDPDLFSRIRDHVKAGHWEITGGWWIQPDCNQPSGFGFERQIQVGKQYLLDHFGVFPQVAYNVDSFGHAATLPGYMHAAGQRCYVMMRPQEHEMTLSVRLFRWRGFETGPEITTFRIAGSYNTWETAQMDGQIKRACEGLPEGMTHTMCFYGVGDHGGGPTEQMIRWITEHQDAIDGCQLVFSSPNRFFAAVESQIATLPVVTGELQMHAIGCYSVQRALKTDVRRTEHLLRQAEVAAETLPGQPDCATALRHAWEQVSFAHFHDILGGTSLPTAYRAVHDRLGAASALADDLLQHGLRRAMTTLPDDPLQRIVLYNASDSPFAGYTEFEPWLANSPASPNGRRLLDEEGRQIPYQVIKPESASWESPRYLFNVTLAPGQLRALRIDPEGGNPVESRVTVINETLHTSDGVAVSLGAPGSLRFPLALQLPLPRLDLIEDRSDNWSHGLDRYPEGTITSATWNAPCVLHNGPCMTALYQTGAIGRSTLRAEWRVYAGEPFVELRLGVHWCERLQLLKMTLPLPSPVAMRQDGIPGAHLQRPNNGRETPVRDWTLLDLGEARFGIVCPDVYALDATPERVRLTLLRSAIMTHHEPQLGSKPDSVISDQGVHEFRFRFFCGQEVTTALLDQQALMLHRPLIAGDLTRGMARRK